MEYKGIIRPTVSEEKILDPTDVSPNTYKGIIRQGVVPDLSKPTVIAGQGEMDKQDLEDFTYQDFKENTQLREAAKRFAVNHLDYKPEEIDDDDVEPGHSRKISKLTHRFLRTNRSIEYLDYP